MYERVSKSFRTGRLERELQMVQLFATSCSCIAILWVILVSFAAITLCVASQRVCIIIVYFVMTPSGNFWIHPHKTYFVRRNNNRSVSKLVDDVQYQADRVIRCVKLLHIYAVLQYTDEQGCLVDTKVEPQEKWLRIGVNNDWETRAGNRFAD
jgi:hypothetical protein